LLPVSPAGTTRSYEKTSGFADTVPVNRTVCPSKSKRGVPVALKLASSTVHPAGGVITHNSSAVVFPAGRVNALVAVTRPGDAWPPLECVAVGGIGAVVVVVVVAATVVVDVVVAGVVVVLVVVAGVVVVLVDVAGVVVVDVLVAGVVVVLVVVAGVVVVLVDVAGVVVVDVVVAGVVVVVVPGTVVVVVVARSRITSGSGVAITEDELAMSKNL
jgi:hypothetical protein